MACILSEARFWRHALVIAGLLQFVFFSRCTLPTQPESTLVLNPGTIVLQTGIPNQFHIIATSTSKLDWWITSQPDWVSFDPSSGTRATTPVKVLAIAHPEGLTPGIYRDSVSFVSKQTSGSELDVILRIAAIQELVVFPIQIEFNDTLLHRRVLAKNTGTETVNWQVAETEEWIFVDPSAGVLELDDSTYLEIEISAEAEVWNRGCRNVLASTMCLPGWL